MTKIVSSTTNGVSMAYSYDPLSRLTNANQFAAYTYDGVGNQKTVSFPVNGMAATTPQPIRSFITYEKILPFLPK